VFPDNTQRTSNMLLSVLHRFGIEEEKIGTSTGRLPNLFAVEPQSADLPSVEALPNL
jgi:hypothetical protein